MFARLALLALLHPLIQNIALAQGACHDYVIMSARGTSEPQGSSVGFRGMINTTLSTLPNGIEYDVVYPASLNLTANLGADDILRYLKKTLMSCPNQQYALLGYSQGAAAVALALLRLTDINTATFKAIKAVLVIDNPGHVANINGNVDQLGGNTTQNYTGLFSFNGSLAIPKVYYAENKVLDICYQGDPICASTYPNNSFSNHVLYGSDQNVQRMGADFLLGKLNGSINGSTTSTTNQPSSTSSPTGSSSTNPSPTANIAQSLISNISLVAMCAIFSTALYSL